MDQNQIAKTGDIDSKKSGRSAVYGVVVIGLASQLGHPDLARLVLDAAVLVAGSATLNA